MAAGTPFPKSRYLLRLYVADHTPPSVAAEHNLRQLCEEHLPSRYDLQVIDLVKNPRCAHTAQILAVPTLVRELPLPIRKFVGDLSDPEGILLDVDLLPPGSEPFADRNGEQRG
ncbi:MAG: circadian clock protein KaiB [Chthoniobacter sp.]|jgi:circadian clock protein KaiB|nr:circadian clock protein KaiB [Chthoniobacter sp.]